MTLPFTMPAADVFFTSPRRVFAHYFYPFPLSVDNAPAASDYYNRNYLTVTGEGGIHAAYGGYLRSRPLPVTPSAAATYQQTNMQTEVTMAIARGITGFVFDILSLEDIAAPGVSTGRLISMIAAAAAVDPRFSIIPMIDMSALGSALTPAQGAAFIQAVASSPNLYRLWDGRIVVAAYDASLQPISWYQQMIGILNAQAIDVAFWPVFLGAPSDGGTLDPISEGLGAWGTAIPSSAAALAATVKTAQAAGLPYLMPILPQQFRPKNQVFQEAGNSLAFRNAWMSAINSEAAAVQIVTWSDFSESGQIQPYTDTTLALNIGTGFYDLNAYYATWFATGTQPPITQEVLYWFHRRMANSAAHPNQTDNFTCGGGTETDNIELLAFLMEPGTLSINGKTLAASAGITSFLQPIAPGNPAFALERNGSNVLAFNSPITIYGPAGSPAGVTDLTYWCGSQAD
jgi:Glycosyl hydrolase family 71